MMLALDPPAVLARYDALCRLVGAQGQGITLPQLGDAHALARILESRDPDPDRVDALAHRLGLDPAELDVLTRVRTSTPFPLEGEPDRRSSDGHR